MVDIAYKNLKKGYANLIAPKFKNTINDRNIIQKVAIKRSNKKLLDKKESIVDEYGFNIITNENILKEASILYHLTCDNNVSGDYLCNFIHFFESDTDYFLVMEYISDITLKQFVEKAHHYIQKSKLNIWEWKKITKYIFWQIAAVLQVFIV